LNFWKERNERNAAEVRQADSHLVGMGRNCFNPVFGSGGNVGRRDLSSVWDRCAVLAGKKERPKTASNSSAASTKERNKASKQALEAAEWLESTLHGTHGALPQSKSAGTWFVFANERFNSGQRWSRDKGNLSPWSYLLSMEGAFLLIGGVNRRLGSRSRPYAVFPFVSEPSQPETDGEIGLARAEFWAPLWDNPATLGEVQMLLQRGLARLGGRAAQAPHEFAVAALAAGVDAGVTGFARYELRQTTSSQVFEAIPREHIKVDPETASTPQNGSRAVASQLLLALIESGWLDRLPYEPRDSKQKGKFVGLRGPVEAAVVQVGERPGDATRWQALLLKLATVQARIDRNKAHRERCAAVRPLGPAWFDLAWPEPDGVPVEIEMARAIASIGWLRNVKTGDLPLVANVFGVEVTARGRSIGVRFPKARTARAVWGNGMPVQVLLDVAHRRLIDADKPASRPFVAACYCSADAVRRLLRNDGSIDLDEVIRWVPALSLIDWSRRPRLVTVREDPTQSSVEIDGTIALHALACPLFHGRKLSVWNSETREREPLFPQKLEFTAGLLRRVFNLLRFNSLDEVIQVLRNRYLAAGRDIVMPGADFKADGELVAASLLSPISDQAVVSGFRRWLHPHKRRSN
jgi:CRISPR-associated protein Csx17